MNAPSLNAIIHRKLLVLVLAPSLVFTLVLGSAIAYRQYTGLVERNAMLTQSLARYVAAYMDDTRHALRHASLDVPAASERALTAELANLYASFPHFERLLWLNQDGDITAAYPSGMVGQDFPFLFNPAGEGQGISRPVYAPGAGGLTIYLAHPARGGWSIVAELSLEALRAHLNDFAPPGEATRLLLTDAHGNLIVHPDDTQVRQQTNVGGWELFSRLGDQERLAAVFRQEGVLHAGAVEVLPELGWRLALFTPLGEILVPVSRTVAGLIVFLLAFFTIIAASFRYELHRRVVAPLSAFAGTLQHAARGDYRDSAIAGPDTFAELGVMEREFTSMAAMIAGRERDLRHSRAHLGSIVDSLASAVLAVDAQARVTLMNAGAARLCGLDPAQARGQDAYRLFPILQGARKHLSAALTMGRAGKLEHQPGPSDARSAFYDLAFAPLSGEGDGGAVIRIEDVTTRVQLEEIMIQTEKMMSVGGLAAGMAHEINNPLGGILQSAQNIRRRTSPELPANREAAAALGTSMDTIQAYMRERGVLRMLDGISESGQRAAAIVANMLNFSRRSSSRHVPTDLHALIERVLALAASDYDLKKRYDFRKIHIQRTFDPALPQVPCTPTEIEQVLLNVFKNAAQAMSGMRPPPARPTLTVTTRAEAGYAEIRIRDNGPGIGPENRKRIFEPFFTTKAPGEGTGLGLSVSYFIITNNHKGSFTLDSEPGHGAEFIIRLPVGTAPPAQRAG
ncbi:sensor histidine kinase [Desulfocurvus vexinensis]|uniref:sensor histidine kinase n=1 Tax=Desulfocurvus vexinensis TaxID=399548 RepID=UPI0004B765CA|nr:PAS domain-containing sensor histidine kinase [Desulfocurvus vexinensis]